MFGYLFIAPGGFWGRLVLSDHGACVWPISNVSQRPGLIRTFSVNIKHITDIHATRDLQYSRASWATVDPCETCLI